MEGSATVVQAQAVDPDKVLDVVTCHYLQSRDFNGMSARDLATGLNVPWDSLHEPLRQLILAEKAGVLFADSAINSHINRTGFEAHDVQIKKLTSADVHHTCVYPRPAHLNKVVDPVDYSARPYCLCLALGEPQFAFRAFDLSVLEAYRNDPRYHYWTSDIGGQICIEHFVG